MNNSTSSTRMPRSRQLKKRRGVSAVEFAITAPVLFLIVFGMVEMTRMFNIEGTCRNAAYLAAREGSLPNTTADEVESLADNWLTAVGMPDHTIEVSPTVLDSTTSEVTVTIEVPLNASNGLYFSSIVAGKTVRVSVTRQREIGS